MASSSLSAVEVFMGEERAVRIEGPVKSRDKGPPLMAKALQMAVILTVSEGWRGSPHWSPEQGRGWDQQGQWRTKLWLVGHGLRKFQIIIDCGQRGVNEEGAESGRGNQGLEFNESNVRGAVTSFEGDGGFSDVGLKKGQGAQVSDMERSI